MMNRNLTILAFFTGCIFSVQSQISLLSTDFESGIPVEYTIVDNDGLSPHSDVSEYTDAWISTLDPEDNTNDVAGSTSYFDPAGTASRWLIAPQLTLGSYGNFISWNAKSHDASFPDDYLVMVSTTDASLTSFTDTIGYIIEEYAEWTNRSVDLSAEGYNDQSIYIAFVNITEDGFKLYLDSINVWKEDPVGISENTDLKLTVYPNPFTNFIKVTIDQEIESMYLTDLSGKKLLECRAKNVISTETLPAGVYLLTVTSGDKKYVRKLIRN